MPRALLLAFVCLAACNSGDEEFVYASRRDAAYPWRDGGGFDAAVEGGTGVVRMDAAARRDAAAWIDGSIYLPDGATYSWMPPEGSMLLADGGLLLPDGGVIDLATAIDLYRERETDVSTCEVGEDDMLVIPDVAFLEPGAFDLAPGPTGFGVAHRRELCGKAEGLLTGRFEGMGTLREPVTVLDECKQIERVELAWGEGGWWMAWTDNSTESIELHAQALDADLALVGERVRLTDNASTEVAPVMATVVHRPMLAWVEVDPQSGARRVMTRVLGVVGAQNVEVVPESADHAPTTLALAQMATGAAAVAWVEEVAQRGMWLQRLDVDGLPVGEPIELTPFAGGGSTIDLATRDNDGGAVVYSVVIHSRANDPTIDQGQEIRFRRLDETGAPRSGEIKVISRPEEAVGASVADVGGGYAVSYRTRPQGSEAPEVRLAFVSKEGNVYRDAQGDVTSFLLAPASLYGSPTKLRASVDGYLMVAYVDGDATSGNTFKILRRSLNCQ